MIQLRLISDFTPEFDLTFLDEKDIPVLLIAIIFLIYVYIKIKRNKLAYSSKLNSESEDKFDFENYDILMQPKKVSNNRLPLINFSLPYFSLRELIFWVALIAFYYLIFTEKI